jgi:hypothetical protein
VKRAACAAVGDFSSLFARGFAPQHVPSFCCGDWASTVGVTFKQLKNAHANVTETQRPILFLVAMIPLLVNSPPRKYSRRQRITSAARQMRR